MTVDFVRVEIAAALERNMRVIPVLFQGVSVPGAEELPAVLHRLARRNAMEVSDHRFRFDVEQLIATMAKDVDAPPVADRSPVMRTEHSALTRRRKHRRGSTVTVVVC